MITRETVFSPQREWRYTLWRDWSRDLLCGMDARPRLAGDNMREQYVQFIGLNPSIADETQDDPTIRRCIAYAKLWGYGAFCMTNIFAWRDTVPKKMKLAEEPIGADNDEWIKRIAIGADMVICAWGNDGEFLNRGMTVKNVLTALGVQCYCLGRNENGEPKHPLYLKKTLQPTPFS